MDYLGRTVVAEVHGKSADPLGFPSELGYRRSATRAELPSI